MRGNQARRRIRRIEHVAEIFRGHSHHGALSSAARPPAPPRSSCARRVGEVNEKVDSQGRAIEETQERTRQNEGRISEVDQKAAAAAQRAAGGQLGGGDSRPERGGRQGCRRRSQHQGRHDGQGQPAARLRSGAERRPGQLQVRQDRAAGRSQAEDRPDGGAAEAGSEEHLPRDRGPHRQRRRRARPTRRSASSAPKR